MIVIGNGESRSNLDLSKLSRSKIGCNAAYRDLQIDHLICVDRRTLDEALPYHKRIYTRPEWSRMYKSVHTVPQLPYQGLQRWDNPWHWGSGPYAVLLATELTQTNRIDLIGFDLYSSTSTVNNVYKDTKNYSKSSNRAVDPTYWIYQIAKIFELYPNIQFIIHQPDNWILPKLWNKSNVFIDKINILHYYKK